MRTPTEMQEATRSGDECWTETLSARADVRGRKNGVCVVGPMGGEGGRRVRCSQPRKAAQNKPHRTAAPRTGRAGAGDHKRPRKGGSHAVHGRHAPRAPGHHLGARGHGNDTRVTCTQLSIHAWTAPLRASGSTASSHELRNCAP